MRLVCEFLVRGTGSPDSRRGCGEVGEVYEGVRTGGITSREVHDGLSYTEDGKADTETDDEEEAR